MDDADRAHLKKLIEKHGFRALLDNLVELETSSVQRDGKDVIEPRCSFCGKSQSEVADRIIGGPGVFVCAVCVDLLAKVKAESWPD